MPRPATPIPNQPKWGPREYSRLRSAKDKGSPGTAWKPMGDYSAQINSLTEFSKVMWKEISKITPTKASRVDMHPFRIYTVNPYLRYATSPSGSFWRTVKVRGGCVLTSTVSTGSIVWGTDMSQTPDFSNYSLPINTYDIEVPLTQSQYWFWVTSLTSSLAGTGSYILSHGANPTVASISNPFPWTTFPSASTSYIPIGFADTKSSGSINQLIVRQFQRTDIVSTGGGSSGSTTSLCYISQLYGAVDYFSAYLSGSTTSSQFYVAKSIPSRCPVSASMFGVNYAYTYTDDNGRLSHSGSTTETQVMIPPFALSQSVFVTSCDHTGVTITGTDPKFVEHSTEREWCHPVGLLVSASVTFLTL